MVPATTTHNFGGCTHSQRKPTHKFCNECGVLLPSPHGLLASSTPAAPTVNLRPAAVRPPAQPGASPPARFGPPKVPHFSLSAAAPNTVRLCGVRIIAGLLEARDTCTCGDRTHRQLWHAATGPSAPATDDCRGQRRCAAHAASSLGPVLPDVSVAQQPRLSSPAGPPGLRSSPLALAHGHNPGRLFTAVAVVSPVIAADGGQCAAGRVVSVSIVRRDSTALGPGPLQAYDRRQQW